MRALQHYGWVDRKAGIARIPIEHAIELLAARGLPAATGAAAEPPKAAALEAQPAPAGESAAPAAPAQNTAPEPKQEGQDS